MAFGDSPLAQLVKELDLCLFLCVIQSLWVRLPEEPINNFSLTTPRQWRQGVNLQDTEEVTSGNGDTKIDKKLCMKHYYNALVGATAWQNDLI